MIESAHHESGGSVFQSPAIGASSKIKIAMLGVMPDLHFDQTNRPAPVAMIVNLR